MCIHFRKFVFLAVGIVCLFLTLAGCNNNEDNDDDSKSNQFAGNYSGTYTGDEDGTWTAVFSDDGKVTATIVSPSMGTLTGNGTISTSGQMSMTTNGTISTGPYSATWSGTFQIQNGVAIGSGTWQSNIGDYGSWEGHRL